MNRFERCCFLIIVSVFVLHTTSSGKKVYQGFQWRSKFVKAHDCKITPCASYPTACPEEYEYLGYSQLTHHTDTFEDCEEGKSKSYCCRPFQGPACIKTPCTSHPQCPPRYQELDRDEVTCPNEEESKFVCCLPEMTPRSYMTSCTNISVASSFYRPLQCPPGYEQSEVKESMANCPESMARINCDKPPPSP